MEYSRLMKIGQHSTTGESPEGPFVVQVFTEEMIISPVGCCTQEYDLHRMPI